MILYNGTAFLPHEKCEHHTIVYHHSIAGLHCHTIIKTIQQLKSRIKVVKEDEYSNSLTKIQVCAMFRAGGIQRKRCTHIYKAMYGHHVCVPLRGINMATRG